MQADRGKKIREPMKNQGLNQESQQANDGSIKVGIQKLESQLTARIREAIGEERVSAFGRRCGIGESTLRKYLDGSMPHAINLVTIADAANVNIEWLATGRGPRQRGSSVPTIPQAPPIPASIINMEDVHRLTLAIEAVDEGLGNIYSTLPADKRAKLVAAAYDLLADMEQKENVIKFIKLAA